MSSIKVQFLQHKAQLHNLVLLHLPYTVLPITIDKTFKSIFQSPFMSRTFLTLHRDSVFLLIYFM